MEARAHTKQAGSGFSNPVWMEGQPRAMPDRSRTPLKLEAKSPEEADALLLDLYTPVFAELGKPSTPVEWQLAREKAAEAVHLA